MNQSGTRAGTPARSAKKFIRSLLAATCLTIAGSATAAASTFFETSVGDFPGTSPGTSLPFGTDTVNGSIVPMTDLDFFEFNGLLGGQSFTLTGSTASNDFRLDAFDSTNTLIGTEQELYSGHNAVITGTTPSDGFLIVEIQSSVSEANSGPYVVTLDAALAAPEPATLALTGLGLATAAALARRRCK